jgi:hypothetical protein
MLPIKLLLALVVLEGMVQVTYQEFLVLGQFSVLLLLKAVAVAVLALLLSFLKVVLEVAEQCMFPQQELELSVKAITVAAVHQLIIF